MAKTSTSNADILAQIPAARDRELKQRKLGLRTKSARYDRRTARVVLELTNGILFAFPVRIIPSLRAATQVQLSAVEVDSSGGALRWDTLDVDLSVPGLLLSTVGADEKRRHFASMIGKVTSTAKAAAARINGAKGGRPSKR